jgi:hypothetical protein
VSTTFKERGPAAVFFLTAITFGIYGIFWFADTKNTMEARGAEVGATWQLFVPILGLIWLWKWCQAAEKVSGGQLSAGSSLVKLWILGPIGMAMMQSAFNKLGGAPAAAGQQPMAAAAE